MKKPFTRAVLDTNVIVSAFLNKDGKCVEILRAFFRNEHQLIMSESIINEYRDVLSRKQFGFADSDINYFFQWIENNALLVEVDESDYQQEDVPDAKDAPFYIAARCTNALLITGNTKHYPVTEWRTQIWEIT